MTGLIEQLLEEFNELVIAKRELDIFRQYNSFQHGKIYKIVNTEDNLVYIGCTTQPLIERFQTHRKKCGTGQLRIHKHMRKLGRDKFSIQLIKEFPTYSRWHLENAEFESQSLIPQAWRLFTPRPRIPFGLSYAEKNRLYSARSLRRRCKAKRTRSCQANNHPSGDEDEKYEMDSETNSM